MLAVLIMEYDEEGDVLLTLGAPTDPLLVSDLPKVPKSRAERELMLKNLFPAFKDDSLFKAEDPLFKAEDPLFKAEDPLLLLEVITPFS